jgi:hypothetical protein
MVFSGVLMDVERKRIHGRQAENRVQRARAITSPAQGDDPNLKALENMNPQERQKYVGLYVAFVQGQLVATDSDRNRLIKKVYKKTRDLDMLVQKVEPDPRVVRFRRPRRIGK